MFTIELDTGWLKITLMGPIRGMILMLQGLWSREAATQLLPSSSPSQMALGISGSVIINAWFQQVRLMCCFWSAAWVGGIFSGVLDF